MFSVHYHIVPFPVAACQHTEMDAEYALSETDGRIVFHALPQREMVVCVRPSEMSRQRAEGGIDVSSDKHPVHVHDIVEVRMMFRISTKAICVKLSVGKTGPRKLMFISVCLLIVIVIEYFKTRETVIEIVA